MKLFLAFAAAVLFLVGVLTATIVVPHEPAVDEPFDSRIKAACAEEFPHSFGGRRDCIDVARYERARDQRSKAYDRALGE